MDYPIESLTPEKFQQLAQAILVREFPNMQCLPVAQPDGGRDAMQWRFHEPKGGFFMFQVKFVRERIDLDDPRKWLLSIIEAEVSKVKDQIPQGAKQYILITNVRGTAHPVAGSIDQANQMLSKAMGIPSVCWWRDDLCRRLDNCWDLKWAYPEIMTGPDLIRYVIEQGLSEQKERRASAVRAFLKYQYSIDREVKFKQVELQNRLLDLFVDVPIEYSPGKGNFRYFEYFIGSPQQQLVVPESAERQLLAHAYLRQVRHTATTLLEASELHPNLEAAYRAGLILHSETQGAAAFLLNSNLQSLFPRLVIEGAPGQGKSTITQYLCQVHRMRLLEIREEFEHLPAAQQSTALRLPIKIDLRDLASWLAKRNPFTAEDGDVPPGEWIKSLEGFLSALIRHQSGGIQFNVADLHAVAKLSAILLVFDGLDEVADIDRRREVVEEIVKGVDRLEANAASLQVVVTSRPAAFANSPGLPDEEFVYFQLGDLNRELIDGYTENWLKARRLHERESAEVKKILKEKLDQPHLKDLARNPMQLAILLSLIHTRGTSLPDKRTALYDSYIELFFNREAEKSPTVRDHRELLINIHRYLAWILHAEVELGTKEEVGRRSGAIAEDKLQDVLRHYLEVEGHDPSLAQTLFTGMVERVVALVSRVQGTYEFEVQPLREYFAARFLYETAPYSPTGAEKHGTKPDRFDAIARDFYWLNVTRFYAGCYSKGELASLIDRLQELIKDPDFGLTNHPRILGTILLSDWVFSQHPKSVTEVLNLILDGIGLRFVLTSNNRRMGNTGSLVLPKGCGRQELIDRCFSLLSENPALDYALDLIDLLKSNASPSELLPTWLTQTRNARLQSRTDWLEFGLQLGCLSTIELSELEILLADEPFQGKRLDLLMRAKRFDFFESNEERYKSAVMGILSLQAEAISGSRVQSGIDLFAHATNPARYAMAFKMGHRASLAETWEHAEPQGFSKLRKISELSRKFGEEFKCNEFIELAVTESERPSAEWATKLSPWDSLVERGRLLWGSQWIFNNLANVASGIKSATETCTDFADPHDDTRSLCRRARYARLRAGTVSWWPKQFEVARKTPQFMSISLLWLTWASLHSVVQSISHFDAAVERLSEQEWVTLYDSIEQSIALTMTQAEDRLFDIDTNSLPARISPRTCAAIGLRSRPKAAVAIFQQHLSTYSGEDLKVLEFCQRCAIRLLSTNREYWKDALKMISHCFLKDVISERFAYHQFIRKNKTIVPLEQANHIVKNANQYPAFLVAAAESKCREHVARKLIPVGQVAERDKWFGT